MTGRNKKAWAWTGIITAIGSLTLALTTQCFSGITWPATGYTSAVILLIVIAALCAGVVNTVTYITKNTK